MTRTFQLPGGSGVVVFPSTVLEYMYGYAQRSCFSREAGGQLFSSTLDKREVEVTHISGPNKGDRRGRHKFDWDIPQANADREAQFGEGRHVIGLWHTHPEAFPSPSGQDEKTTRQFLEAMDGTMQGFLQVIVGNKGTVPHIGVWVAQNGPRKSWIAMEEIQVTKC